MKEAKGVIVKHILVVKFKEDTEEGRIEELIKEFAGLREIIKTVKDFTWGKDVSTANLHKGNTHVFQLTFESMEDVEAYMAHGAHMAFAQQLLGATDSVILMDYKPISDGIKKKTGCLPFASQPAVAFPSIMGMLLIVLISRTVFYFNS